ncbi:MerR family transcriptional regulator [Corynebacterium freiburgense]|uniref:MerR family transcriptional regulator n=1 Tax=Corynebacterium freiburgense TaxID=556548 RepID=UPI000427235C|nr:MerR family transcriptional regulator [Corynebacterium freiburgense]WJZ02698.1 Multidrug-efflux transporter 1 regulator [Corynebacterium freiburgense]
MLKIGQFSLVSGLSIKALRFYDQCGLLPAEIDPLNGYRWYSPTQLESADLIRVLRASGLSIEQTRNALQPAARQEILAKHEKELQQRRALEDRALAVAKTWEKPNFQVQTRTVEQLHWVAFSTVLDLTNTPAELESQCSVLNSSPDAATQRLICGEPWQWFSPHSDTRIQARTCYPVSELPSETTMQCGTLPRRREAFVVTGVGDYPALEDLPGGPLPHPCNYSLVKYLDEHGIEQEEFHHRLVNNDQMEVIAIIEEYS